MKKIVLAALATAAFAATPAAAQNSATINLQGNVPLSCTVVANPSIVNPEVVILTDTTNNQQLGSLTYSCNNAGGFTRTVTSANSGLLKRVGGGANEANIPYLFLHDGGSGIDQALISLQAPVSESMGGSAAFINGQTGSVRVKMQAASGPLFAGNYGDTITIAIAPNN